MPIEVDSVDELAKMIFHKGANFITIDGRDGAGKTYLANQLSRAIGATHITEEEMRDTDLYYRFVPKSKELEDKITKGIQGGRVVFDSVLMMWVLEHVSTKPDLKVYVKRMSPMGLWGDESEVGGEVTREIVIGGVPSSEQFNFRRQIINYHYDYVPYESADIIYNRQEVNGL